jgi:hypothetical protein
MFAILLKKITENFSSKKSAQKYSKTKFSLDFLNGMITARVVLIKLRHLTGSHLDQSSLSNLFFVKRLEMANNSIEPK